jgi:hypothetical protein
MSLVPIKVRIGLKSEKNKSSHAYPDFNSLPSGLRGNTDWSHFVDQHGGWHYDKVAGHSDADQESPRGTWLGMLLVPEEFANAAAEKFPDTVSIIAESEAERFYEQRVTVNQPGILDDASVLQAVAAKRAAGLPEDDDDKHALDPDHPATGRRRNKLKTWKGYCQQRGVEIHEKYRKK